METLTTRLDSRDVDLLAAAIAINRETGGNLTEVLERLAKTVRQRREIRAEAKSLTAAPRATSYILAVLPFAIARYTIAASPIYREHLLGPGLGRLLMIGAVVRSLIGFWISQKLAKAEYKMSRDSWSRPICYSEASGRRLRRPRSTILLCGSRSLGGRAGRPRGDCMNTTLSILTDPASLAALAIFCMVFGLTIALTQRQSGVSLRLARHVATASGTTAASSPARAPLRSWRPRVERPAVLDRLTARFNTEERRNEARALLNQAGKPISLEVYSRLRTIFLLVLTPLFALLAIVALGQSLLGLAAAALSLLTVPRLPAIYPKRLAKQVQHVVCVEGGQSLQAALLRLSQRMDNVAAEEFSRLLTDINSGMSRRDAFTALAARDGSEALGITATTIIHADKAGMSLAHTLRTLSDMMRTRRRRAAETKARQAPIKMMPVLVGFLLPYMLALLLGLVALEVMQNFR